MKILQSLILSSTITFSSLAQMDEVDEVMDPMIKKQAEENVEKKLQEEPKPIVKETKEVEKDKLLYFDSLIETRDKKYGYNNDLYSTEKDWGRYGLLIHANSNPLKILNFLGAEFQYGKKLRHVWVEGLILYGSTKFSTIGINHSSSGTSNSSAEENFIREEDQRETLLQMGLGLNYSFPFPKDLNIYKVRNLFHSTAFYLTYLNLNEGLRNENYQGGGMRFDYGIHKRLRTMAHVGFKFSFNVGVVKRGEKIKDEENEERQFVLSWSSLSFDYSFYF